MHSLYARAFNKNWFPKLHNQGKQDYEEWNTVFFSHFRSVWAGVCVCVQVNESEWTRTFWTNQNFSQTEFYVLCATYIHGAWMKREKKEKKKRRSKRISFQTIHR